jgi:hypothetical protein
MSLFNYPRINFQGLISFNPGTANNADYAQNLNFKHYDGTLEPLSLIDPCFVEPNTYGMSDEEFTTWVQHKQQFYDGNGDPAGDPIFPSEWNYYGPMTMGISELSKTKIIGVQADASNSYTEKADDIDITSMIGDSLTMSGHITDVNSEGSPPATQFFIDNIKIGDGAQITGFSKGVGQFLNFYRNINLTQDGGAGAYVYYVIPKEKLGSLSSYFTGDNIAGAICRYYLYRPQLGSASQGMYDNQQENPAPLEIVGTFAPWYKGEDITTVPVGRLLTSDIQNIPMPTDRKVLNNGFGFGKKNGEVALAPAILSHEGETVSIDCVATFPDFYNQQNENDNPKYDFGTVSLMVSDGENTAKVEDIPYQDTQSGNANGWVFNFDITNNEEAKSILSNPNQATFSLQFNNDPVLNEVDYYFVSNQCAVYGEQSGSPTEFWNEVKNDNITVAVFSRGVELNADNCPPISAWQYKSVPLQDPGKKELITDKLRPGDPISLDVSQPGNFLLTFGINTPSDFPPEKYLDFMNPPYITNAPQISIRILPNNVDFSEYYENPDAPENELVGNEKLTFDIVYKKSLRTYDLLYPSMKYKGFDLADCEAVSKKVGPILNATSSEYWMSVHYMPRTRDLSISRRNLLQAWCRKVQNDPDSACGKKKL